MYEGCVINFSPWTYDRRTNKVIVEDFHRWLKILSLNSELSEGDTILKARVYTDTLRGYGPDTDICNEWGNKLYTCEGCFKFHYQAFNKCGICGTHPTHLNIIQLRYFFFQLIDRTPNLHWQLITTSLFDIRSCLIPPIVKNEVCFICNASKGKHHVYGRRCSIRNNLSVVVMRDKLDRLDIFEAACIANRETDILFTTPTLLKSGLVRD